MDTLPSPRKALRSSAAGSPLSLGFVALFVGSAEPWHKPQPPEPPPNSTRGQLRLPALGPGTPSEDPANSCGLRSGVARSGAEGKKGVTQGRSKKELENKKEGGGKQAQGTVGVPGTPLPVTVLQPQENLLSVSLGRTGLPVTPRRSGQSAGTPGRPQEWGREGWLALGHRARSRDGGTSWTALRVRGHRQALWGSWLGVTKGGKGGEGVGGEENQVLGLRPGRVCWNKACTTPCAELGKRDFLIPPLNPGAQVPGFLGPGFLLADPGPTPHPSQGLYQHLLNVRGCQEEGPLLLPARDSPHRPGVPGVLHPNPQCPDPLPIAPSYPEDPLSVPEEGYSGSIVTQSTVNTVSWGAAARVGSQETNGGRERSGPEVGVWSELDGSIYVAWASSESPAGEAGWDRGEGGGCVCAQRAAVGSRRPGQATKRPGPLSELGRVQSRWAQGRVRIRREDPGRRGNSPDTWQRRSWGPRELAAVAENSSRQRRASVSSTSKSSFRVQASAGPQLSLPFPWGPRSPNQPKPLAPAPHPSPSPSVPAWPAEPGAAYLTIQVVEPSPGDYKLPALAIIAQWVGAVDFGLLPATHRPVHT
ncbi:hypothetical protein Cadr_000018668 [Camelus dromedarius]|uniref:Uncharacterized protein n=1 Tax=Camelus dromedarius TaxID=9838 RepID=A0A5N4D2R6_CAMDR|nr:hypothetical protein Cadr_000018668 [Camelus dromedarius]